MFADRKDAGKKLAQLLFERKFGECVVFGIPRGGVVVAKEVADRLSAPLDIVVTRKLGTPFNPELGFGAIGPSGSIVFNKRLLGEIRISRFEIDEAILVEQKELARRIKEYNGMKINNLLGKTAILVDDGIATGYTILAAVKYLKTINPAKIVVASPVCAPDSAEMIRKTGIETICLKEPWDFQAVGQFYEDFPQTSDTEVKALLKR